MLGIITGSGLYELADLSIQEELRVETRFGSAEVVRGVLDGVDVAFIARHGRRHELLPNMINYRANLSALHELGVNAIIATSVMGVVDGAIDLGRILFFEDMYFMDNRLPDGTLCTLFDAPGEPGRGHYIFSSPYSSGLQKLAKQTASGMGIAYVGNAVYGHVNGPRFNSKAEIRLLQGLGVSAISQTAGPEAVLAGELELPYLLVGFGIDYANGVAAEPTPIEVLDSNLQAAADIMPRLIKGMATGLNTTSLQAEGFVYRFD